MYKKNANKTSILCLEKPDEYWPQCFSVKTICIGILQIPNHEKRLIDEKQKILSQSVTKQIKNNNNKHSNNNNNNDNNDNNISNKVTIVVFEKIHALINKTQNQTCKECMILKEIKKTKLPKDKTTNHACFLHITYNKKFKKSV